MNTNESLTDERLVEARAALNEDTSQWGGEYGLDLLAEVERLRALTTADAAMVERAAFALARKKARDPLFPLGVPGHVLLEDAKTVLDAALNPPGGNRMTRGPMTQGRVTITDDMVKRATHGIAAHWHDMHTNESLGRQQALAIAALEAALNPGEGS